MLDEKDLQAIAQLMDIKLEPIQKDLSSVRQDLVSIKDRLDALEEAHDATRTGVNKLLEWSENAGYIIHYPLDKVK